VKEGRFETTFWRWPKLETFPTVASAPMAAKALFAALEAGICGGRN